MKIKNELNQTHIPLPKVEFAALLLGEPRICILHYMREPLQKMKSTPLNFFFVVTMIHTRRQFAGNLLKNPQRLYVKLLKLI